MTQTTKAERRHAGLAYIRSQDALDENQIMDVEAFSRGLNVSVGIAVASRGFWELLGKQAWRTLGVLETW